MMLEWRIRQLLEMGISCCGRLFLLCSCLFWLRVDLPCEAEEPFGEQRHIDFGNEILPILTKAGCNAGACHGAAIGRGDFRLSLYGQNPDADWIEVARQLGGRRINQVEPELSLLLRKGGEFVEHGGGQRLNVDGDDWKTLVQWISQGAIRRAEGSQGRLVGIQVQPRKQQASVQSEPIEIKVYGEFEDGSLKDLTKWAIFQPTDPDAVRNLSVAGQVELLRSGRHVLLVRVRDHIAIAELIVTEVFQEDGERKELALNSPIDQHINDLLVQLDLTVGDKASDLVLLRRATLDLTGRLPTVDEIRTYVQDQRVDKFERKIDQLLASEGMRETWGYWLGAQLGAAQLDRRGSPSGRSKTYLEFLKDEIDAGATFPELLARMIEADGRFEAEPAVAFYLGSGDGREQTERFADYVLGVRIGCANCHNHPFDRWTQDDYHGLAALFAGIRRGETVTWKPGAENTHPATGEPAVARLLDGTVVDAGQDPRPVLADWVRNSGRRPISLAWANRVWAVMFGRGLVDPTDDLRVTNPPTHPELLVELVDRWGQHDGDLKWLLREIMLSDVYQRESIAIAGDRQSVRMAMSLSNYGYRTSKPIAAPILLDAYSQVTDIWMSLEGESEGTRAVSVVMSGEMSPAENKGDCQIAICGSDLNGSLSGRLALIVGPMLNVRLRDPDSRITKWAADESLDDAAVVEQLYLHCFCRYPSEMESNHWIAVLHESTDRSKVIEDIAWSMLTSRQFAANH